MLFPQLFHHTRDLRNSCIFTGAGIFITGFTKWFGNDGSGECMVVFSAGLAVGAYLFQLVLAVAFPGNAEVDPHIGGLVGLHLEILFPFYDDDIVGRIGVGELTAVVLGAVGILGIGSNGNYNKEK